MDNGDGEWKAAACIGHSPCPILHFNHHKGANPMQEYQKPRAIALGYFDGVHLGHQALMERAVERARQIGRAHV